MPWRRGTQHRRRLARSPAPSAPPRSFLTRPHRLPHPPRPQGVCSRAFVEGGTHNTNFDGVCFYPKWSLPGYAAIFRHPNDELNYCYYLIPCGKVRAFAPGWATARHPAPRRPLQPPAPARRPLAHPHPRAAPARPPPAHPRRRATAAT
jgi:hypothetical protein